MDPPTNQHFRYSDSDEFQFGSSDQSGAFASSNSCRYKLMSPAKLPISRTPCLTIPRGISPSSLLDSPIQFCNTKVEPSPTTGALRKPQPTLGSGECTGSASTSYSSSSTYPTKSFKYSDLRTQSCSSFPSGSSVLTNQAFTGMNSQQFEQLMERHDPVKEPSPLSRFVDAAAPSYDFDVMSLTHAQPNQSPASYDDLLRLPGQQNPGESDPQSVTASPSDQNEVRLSATMDTSDGYNWRKYGQKHVKGCTFPRSYYKCTHPNCEVKKLLERSHDGRVTEIIYKGTHAHPKPQSKRRFQNDNVMGMPDGNMDTVSYLNEAYVIPEESTFGNHSQGATPLFDGGSEPPSEAPSDEEHNDNKFDVDGDDPDSKRRKQNMGVVHFISSVKPIREPRVVVQTVSEVDILDDGYRWRKYGQKVVKGNPNPRSYYKCTNPGCAVRKHVERACHDIKSVITTYEGKHNHDVPLAKSSNQEAVTTDPYTSYTSNMRYILKEADSVTLNLKPGLNSSPEARSNDRFQATDATAHQTQFHIGNAHAAHYQIPADLHHQYHLEDNQGETFRFPSPYTA